MGCPDATPLHMHDLCTRAGAGLCERPEHAEDRVMLIGPGRVSKHSVVLGSGCKLVYANVQTAEWKRQFSLGWS